MQLLILSFKSAFKSYFSVLKPIHNYFGYYFLAGSFLLAFVFSFFGSSEVFTTALVFLTDTLVAAFMGFMIPYYAYKEHTGSAPPFWDFIRKKLWPLVWNHIKAFLIVLLFLFLLIIPGIYKIIRYGFLTETVFFDSPAGRSRLKSADKTTRGFFWTVFFFLLVKFSLPAFLIFASKLLLKLSFLPLVLTTVLKIAISFYLLCYFLLLKVHFYFHLKEKRGESLSL